MTAEPSKTPGLTSLKIFRDVVAAGGFSAAYRKTGQSRATLSRHIAELEQELGARLIERSTRSFRLTEQGQVLYERSLDIFQQVDEALAMVEDQQREPTGLVRVAIPPSLLNFQIGNEILRYMQTYKRVRVQIEASNRQVDLYNEGMDFVVRARTRLDYPNNHVTVLLARMALTLVVHPRWQSALLPGLAETLEHVPAIAWRGMDSQSHWQLLSQQGHSVDLRIHPRLVVDDMQTLRNAALGGIGIAMIPKIYVEDDIAQGRLHELQVDLMPPPSVVHAVHLGRRGMRPAVRHLLDWLKEATRPLR